MKKSAHVHSALVQKGKFRARKAREECGHFDEVRRKNFRSPYWIFDFVILMSNFYLATQKTFEYHVPWKSCQLKKNKSIVFARQTINNLTANALESLYYLHIKKVFGDKSEFRLYLLQKQWLVDSNSSCSLKVRVVH